MPIVIAHTIIDIASFAGYAILKPYLTWLQGPERHRGNLRSRRASPVRLCAMRVGVFGATGQVGRVMLTLLAERKFPSAELRVFSSARSAGRTVTCGGKEYVCLLYTSPS